MNDSSTNVLVQAASVLSEMADLARSGEAVMSQLDKVKTHVSQTVEVLQQSNVKLTQETRLALEGHSADLASAVQAIEKSNSAVVAQSIIAIRVCEEVARDIRSAHGDMLQLRREVGDIAKEMSSTLASLHQHRIEDGKRMKRMAVIGFVCLGGGILCMLVLQVATSFFR